MELNHYEHRRNLLAIRSSVCVLVLANESLTDAEFIAVHPHVATLPMPPEFAGRGLCRNLGMLALVDGEAKAEFREPLPESVVIRLAETFAAYAATVKSTGADADGTKAECDWLEALYSLVDTRD